MKVIFTSQESSDVDFSLKSHPKITNNGTNGAAMACWIYIQSVCV